MDRGSVVLVVLLNLALLFHDIESKQAPSFEHFPGILAPSSLRSSVVFPLSGNVFPLGYYSVSLRIGNPPKAFDFDVDTGSDLAWVQCDAPCSGCTLPRERQYKPMRNMVQCSDPLCLALHFPNKPKCLKPTDQCDYEVSYADQGSSMGVLVIDQIPFTLLNGSASSVRLAFGCGYDQQVPGPHPPPATAGVLGIGRGIISFLTQLVTAGLTKNVMGHCLSHKGGGFLFFGDNPIPSSGVAWAKLSKDGHYSVGSAELLFNGKSTGEKGLDLIFDSGSSYTYFNSKTYQTIVNLITNDLKGKPLKDAKEDRTLPICWKGAKPFKSVLDAKSFFKTLTISFSGWIRKTQFQIQPESYLIVTTGNVCLGILNGSEVGLQNANVIGDIFMQGTMVIYDNEKQQLGWVSADCDKHPRLS
ncbi:PREDICTED: aspartic proteinase Asp1 [Tarenaya hassleriana]|uniref:aspartic proteinase Asp1 n=1 Tax=Tarenaya hassleriana TaxID=28532 RepID=UPI00053C9B7F|nr:PREDICTED: aspartic proteinase Asp1 [Tarenaya hassleriana]